MRGGALACLVPITLASSLLAQEPIRPAELPSADFAGQQYVDSKGCMFVRAGREGEVLWIPRVSREGTQVCGNPPSGNRVPVAEEIGVQPVPSSGIGNADVQDVGASEGTAVGAASTGGYFVAVGSFGVAENAAKAEARVIALNYGVVKGRVLGASTSLITVFAGPFADAAAASAARVAIAGDGFTDAIVIQP